MPVPLAGIAAAAAARLVAKKLAGKAVKKVASKSVKKAAAAKKQAATRAETIKVTKSSVKVVPRRTAPKTGLENRGAKLTPKEQARRASDLKFGKMEQRFDRSTEMRSTGLVSSKKGLTAARGPGKKNQRKSDAMEKEARKVNIYEPTKKAPIKIDSGLKKNPLKGLKPMENVPRGVSARFDATNARLAKEAAKKKK